jgi:hypothetical protein
MFMDGSPAWARPDDGEAPRIAAPVETWMALRRVKLDVRLVTPQIWLASDICPIHSVLRYHQ